ncbi:MAG: HIT family protein [Acidimicrobiia bacterium]
MSALDRIWAGWRSAYVTGLGDPAGGEDGCLFCTLVACDDSEALILERTELTFTVMNAFPYTTGHVMVAPLRHEAEFEGLTAAEGVELFAGLQRAVVAIKEACRPHGLNLGVNVGRVAGAGVPGHVHAHALPRWDGDSNFMTTVAEARVLSEDLSTTWEKLRKAWPSTETVTPPG